MFNSIEKSVLTHQQLVVDRLDDDFLGFVLTDVEPKFQHFVVTVFLDQWRVDALDPTAAWRSSRKPARG